MLASIEVECDESDEQRELLRRFIARVQARADQALSREGSASPACATRARSTCRSSPDSTPSASETTARPTKTSVTASCIAELRARRAAQRRAPVSSDARRRAGRSSMRLPRERPRLAAAPSAQTPLAARTFAIDIEDAGGVRRVELTSVVPGRRYAVGKGEDCDIVGRRRSTRAAGIARSGSIRAPGGSPTLDRPTASASSRRSGAIARASPGTRAAAARLPAIELPPGAWLVLSEHTARRAAAVPALVAASGRRCRDSQSEAGERERYAADAGNAYRAAAPARGRADHHRPHGIGCSHRRDSLRARLPFRVGRSRNQALVIDWAHADVSGRHFEIVALDESGAQIVVHGDNGVTVDGTSHGPGAQFKLEARRDARARRRRGQTSVVHADAISVAHDAPSPCKTESAPA